MFVVHEDMTIYATRGDVVYFPVEKKQGDAKYLFQPGDIVRIKICEKKNYAKVLLLKDFVVEEESTSVNIFLDRFDTKFGEIINKPVDYWYEIELNPDTFPDTFVGHNEKGAAIFRLFPEAKDVVEGEIPDPEENAAVSRMVVTFVTEYLGNKVDVVIKELLEKEAIEIITNEILQKDNLETIIKEIIREENVETIVEKILEQNNMQTIVQEITKVENIGTIVQEILKPENTATIVEQVLEEVMKRLPGAGVNGVTFTPKVDAEGNLSWTNDGGLENPAVVNIRGRDGAAGRDGQDGAAGRDGVDGKDGATVEEVLAAVPAANSATISKATDGTITITTPMSDGTTSVCVLTPGADGFPIMATIDGNAVPLTWEGW